ncbi:MAG TPA: UbiA family prenyltransferase [Candidatus Deferrimicrobium sp.]|nr:UbiA family prenyltransferase [Candidatus Deferrimicrobium sp.]
MDFKAVAITISQKVFAFMDIARISVIFMGLPFAMAGAAYALWSTSVAVTLIQAIGGILSVFFVTGSVHIMDDFFDRRRDRSLWPDRQIPSRGLTPRGAVVMATVCCGIGVALTFFFYNIFCVIILLIATSWAIAYAGHLREKYGYLTLPFAIGLFPIGGYVAFAPSTLLMTGFPWLLYLMVFFWQAAHILVYSPPHGVENGKTVVPLFLKRFSPETTLILAGVFAAACMTVGIIVFFTAPLSYFYLGITVSLGLFLTVLALYVSRAPTVKKCMNLVILNSAYGWLIFLIMTLEFLYVYDIIFFWVVLIFGIFMMLLTAVFGGFREPNSQIKARKSNVGPAQPT